MDVIKELEQGLTVGHALRVLTTLHGLHQDSTDGNTGAKAKQGNDDDDDDDGEVRTEEPPAVNAAATAHGNDDDSAVSQSGSSAGVAAAHDNDAEEDEEDEEDLAALFKRVDTDGDGQISKDEAMEYIQSKGVDLPAVQLDMMWKQIDTD
eukprot:COSAG02_NODE_23463_length_718_cov_0.739903_1_plen_149_part_01